MNKKLNIANAVTASRIVFAVLVLFSPAFSVRFYVWYVLGVLSDMIDGCIARRLGLQSEFGSKLDTVSDCLFVIFVIIKVVFAVAFPTWIWVWIGVILLIKVINFVSSFVVAHGIVPMHTTMNKVTGLILFTLPFVIGKSTEMIMYTVLVIAGLIATFAAIQEGHYIRMGKVIE